MEALDRAVLRTVEMTGLRGPVGFNPDVVKNALTYKPRNDDLFIATYPKCGTTWAQQIVYLIYNNGVPADTLHGFFLRSPFLEVMGKESGELFQRPGAIKVHLPYHLTPYSDKAKYIYVVRNPKDTAVSYYHHAITDTLFGFQEGTFETYFEHFMNGTIVYGDYFDHVLGWYAHRNDPNITLIMYEELKRDTENTVMKIAKFMGECWLELLQNSPKLMDDVLKYSSAEYMKTVFNTKPSEDYEANSTGRYDAFPGMKHVMEFSRKHQYDKGEKFTFVRKAVVGNWREVLSEDQNARLDAKIEGKLKGTELYSYWKSINCI